MRQYHARELRVVCDTNKSPLVRGSQREVCVPLNAGDMTVQPKCRSNTLIKRLRHSTYNAGS